MQIIHHTLGNGSGLRQVAVNMAIGEKRLGLDSYLSFTDGTEIKDSLIEGVGILSQKDALEADVHVIHSHIQDKIKGKTIFVPHGTPEHCFTIAIEQNKTQGYGAGDPFMLSLHRLNNTDLTVTFWPRHQYIWQTLCPKATIKVIPMGINKDFWKPVESRGKWVGKPSLLTCENAHQIKWPLDLFLAFPLINHVVPDSIIHSHYMPLDQHRWWYPLIFANGTAYKSFTSGTYMSPEELRNAFCSVDYYINPVRYGDFNNLTLEAKACGCKVISYRGNPYADYWLTEGSQIDIAKEMIRIFTEDITPLKSDTPSSIDDMANAMAIIYRELLHNKSLTR